MIAAAASGALGALVVGGVDAADLGDDTAYDALEKAFVVSLEYRPSSVTAYADVVLPVAPHAEKSGTFVDWEGRVRPFEAALETNALSDYRVLDLLAGELGEFLGTRSLAQVQAEMAALGPWTGPRARSSTSPWAPRNATNRSPSSIPSSTGAATFWVYGPPLRWLPWPSPWAWLL